MANVSIRLNHRCNHPKCKGKPGEIVKTDLETAEMMIDRGGAVMVASDSGKEKATDKKAGKTETAAE